MLYYTIYVTEKISKFISQDFVEWNQNLMKSTGLISIFNFERVLKITCHQSITNSKYFNKRKFLQGLEFKIV